ncbi:MAG TPA: YpdA family putative bacillithiol disulfide reductase [Gemmatimonadaceae bacterium]|nr:YpdA family putative bacillithiol disulfide reductase [Gemmatimonadaceae bacterium]
MRTHHLPVAVVGAGPCGLASAVALKAAGIPAVVFDKGRVAQSIADYPTHLTMFSTPEKLVIGGVEFACAGFRPTRAETLAYYRAVAARYAVDVRQQERVLAVERSGTSFIVRTAVSRGGNTSLAHHAARAVVVATGYFDYPNMLGVPGEDLPHVSHRFVEGHGAFGRNVVVVGGGNSAVEAAIELARCGARVALVHYEQAFVSHVIKPWVLPEFEQRVAAGEIAIRWGARLRGITPIDATVADGTGATERLPADFVYLMTGYTPKPGLLGDLGVSFDPETGIPAHNPATMETTVPGVFVAGVITSGKKANGIFIENGRGHGALIASALTAR